MTCVVCSQYNVRSDWLTILPVMPAGRLRACKSNKYGLLTKCSVKMAGYWPSSFFARLWTETKTSIGRFIQIKVLKTVGTLQREILKCA